MNINSKGILGHLCGQMDKLNDRSITTEEAQAQANLAKQANNLLKYELQKAKTLATNAGNFTRIED